jgi:hypothetical protein
MERQGQDNVQQHNIVEEVIKRIVTQGHVSIDKTMETKKQIQNVIQHLITKENILMITQDAKTKDERYLSLNINIDLENLPALEGSKEAVF